MKIRRYQESDCAEIADLFHGSVHAIDHAIYSQAELEAWAPSPPDYEAWKQRLAIKQPYVACEHEKIVGFVELEQDGHIDCLYVHQDFLGLGIASYLLQHVISVAKERELRQLHVEASKLAVPLFKKFGFEIRRSNSVERRGQYLKNFNMCRSLEH